MARVQQSPQRHRPQRSRSRSGCRSRPTGPSRRAPRLIAARQGHALFHARRPQLLDGSAGLWCTNAGHNRDPIVAAIQRQAAELDYAPAFQFAPSRKPSSWPSRIAALAPGDLDHVFFCNSGSEAVDTALKIALAYHNVRGNASRTRLIGRERGYHGVGFGGIVGRRHRRQPQAVRRAAGRRRSSAGDL